MKTRILTSIIFSSVVFLFGPLSTYSHNHMSLSIPIQYVLLIGVSLFLAVTLMIFLFLCLFRDRLLSVICAVIIGISIYFWFSSNFLDWNLGALRGREIDWSMLVVKGRIELTLFVLFLLGCIYYHKRVTSTIGKICVFLLFVQFVSFSYFIATTPSARVLKSISTPRSDERRSFSFSSQKNAIIIVLDAFANDVFDNITDLDNSINNIFKDFTYFKNTTAGFPTTVPSIPMMLHGRMYSNEDGPFSVYQKKIMNENSLPLLLKENGYDVIVSKVASTYFKNSQSDLQEAFITTVKYWIGEFLRDIMLISLIREVPLLTKKLLLENQFYLGKIYKSVNNDILFFYNYIATADNISPSFTFRCYHLLGIHPPHSLRSDITIRSNNIGMENDPMLEQGIGYLRMVDKFLEKLKNIGVYDNSIILVCADHGKPGETYSSLPLLLIKPINAIGKRMSVSFAPAALSDIPKTIAESLQLQNNLPGVNVFSIKESEQRSRHYYHYVWMQEYWRKDMLPPITKIEIISLFPTKSINLGNDIAYPDLSIPIYLNKENSHLQIINTFLGEFHLPGTHFQWTNGNSFITINSNTPIDSKKRVSIHIEGRNLTQKRPTKIFWNDEELGTVNEQKFKKYLFSIPIDRITQQNELRFFTPDALTPKSLGIYDDVKTLGFALRKVSFDIFD